MAKKGVKRVKEPTLPKKNFSWIIGIIFMVIILIVIFSVMKQNRIASLGQATTSGGDYESSDCDDACNVCTETCEFDRVEMKYKWVYDHFEKVPVNIYRCKDNGRVTCSTWNPLDDNCCESYEQCFSLTGSANLVDCFFRCKPNPGPCQAHTDSDTCKQHSGCWWDDRDYV